MTAGGSGELQPILESGESDSDSGDPTSDSSTIAGFWWRVLAAVLDWTILGAIGFLVGLLFFKWLAMAGFWARVVGFAIAVAYLGVLNSKVGGGATLGKRITKLQVVGRSGSRLSLGASTVRSVVLAVPFFLNGAILPSWLETSPLGHLVGVAIFGLGLGTIYLYIFNRRTRQSAHDLVVDSFVVRAGSNVVVDDSVARSHLIVVGIWCFVVLVGSWGLSSAVGTSEFFSQLSSVQQAIRENPEIYHASAMKGARWNRSWDGESTVVNYFQSNTFWKSPPADVDAAMEEVARAIVRTYPPAKDLDGIHVTISYGYDMGISQRWTGHQDYRTPSEWLSGTSPAPAKTSATD